MISSILAFACLAALGHCSLEDAQWLDYKSSFSKVYATEEEDLGRLDIWKANLAMVEHHNEEAAEGIHGYTMAINQFSDLTDEEFEIMLGFKHNDIVSETVEHFQVKETPAKIDYRDEGLVTEVKDQGHCGSCWAFSGTGGIEGAWAKKVGELISVSEQQLIDCGPGDCDGGSRREAWKIAEGGMMTEEDYPYRHEEHHCHFHSHEVVSSITGYKSVSHDDEDQLELALAEVGYPISITMRASPTFRHYSSGVYDDIECINDGESNHAILIVGYHKTDSDNLYWIVKNSWGQSFGEDGYIKMRMRKNICGLAHSAKYPVIEI